MKRPLSFLYGKVICFGAFFENDLYPVRLSFMNFFNHLAVFSFVSAMICKTIPVASTKFSHSCLALNSALFMYLQFLRFMASSLNVCPLLIYSRSGHLRSSPTLRCVPPASCGNANAHESQPTSARPGNTGAPRPPATAAHRCGTGTQPRRSKPGRKRPASNLSWLHPRKVKTGLPVNRRPREQQVS